MKRSIVVFLVAIFWMALACNANAPRGKAGKDGKVVDSTAVTTTVPTPHEPAGNRAPDIRVILAVDPEDNYYVRVDVSTSDPDGDDVPSSSISVGLRVMEQTTSGWMEITNNLPGIVKYNDYSYAFGGSPGHKYIVTAVAKDKYGREGMSTEDVEIPFVEPTTTTTVAGTTTTTVEVAVEELSVGIEPSDITITRNDLSPNSDPAGGDLYWAGDREEDETGVNFNSWLTVLLDGEDVTDQGKNPMDDQGRTDYPFQTLWTLDSSPDGAHVVIHHIDNTVPKMEFPSDTPFGVYVFRNRTSVGEVHDECTLTIRLAEAE